VGEVASASWRIGLNDREGIYHRFKHGRFFRVGSCLSQNERDTSSFDHNMAFRA